MKNINLIVILFLFFHTTAEAEVLGHNDMLKAQDCTIGLNSELMYAIRDNNKKLKYGLEQRLLKVRADLLETIKAGSIGPDEWLEISQKRQKIAMDTLKNKGPDEYALITYNICRHLGY